MFVAIFSIAHFRDEAVLTLFEDVPVDPVAHSSLPLIFFLFLFPSKDPPSSDPNQYSNLHKL